MLIRRYLLLILSLSAVCAPAQAAQEPQQLESGKPVELGNERGALIDMKARTPEEEQRLAKLDADLVVAGNAFQSFLSHLESELGKSAEPGAKVYAMRESQGLMEDLRELGKGAVALYTLVGEEQVPGDIDHAGFSEGLRVSNQSRRPQSQSSGVLSCVAKPEVRSAAAGAGTLQDPCWPCSQRFEGRRRTNGDVVVGRRTALCPGWAPFILIGNWK